MTGHERDKIFEEWMTAHQGIVLKVARSFATGHAEQDDLAQDIRIAIWRSVPAFLEGSKASTYIYRVALNRSISWKRRRNSDREKMDRYQASIPKGPDHAASGRSNLDRIYAAIRRLNDAERSLVLLFLDDLSYQEMAEILGISVTNVGVRLNRVKKRLTEIINNDNHEH